MLVKDIMTKDVGGIVPETTLKEAAHKMESLGVGFLPVCDGERLTGVITDRDIVVRAVAEGKDPSKETVKNYMSPEIVWCFEDQKITEAARMMEKKKVRRILVMNHQKLLAGVVSLGDIAVYAEEPDTTSELVTEVSRPAQPKRGA
ncbi:MAG: CBS domain-containing protein [Candidatus Omnitrophica bacterium]|nr:CBS domain-containing protein [Candidatus Omnitrophota bacterium]MDD5553227.1 CBS domain-containing protein [Candidatus Omnitrophota bacterium]